MSIAFLFSVGISSPTLPNELLARVSAIEAKLKMKEVERKMMKIEPKVETFDPNEVIVIHDSDDDDNTDASKFDPKITSTLIKEEEDDGKN